jgi:hypothetical protein
LCRFATAAQPAKARELVEAILATHSYTLPRSACSAVPLAGISNDLVAICTNPDWVKFQGPANRPNYLVINMTREADAPGLAAQLQGGAYPHLRAEVGAAIRVAVGVFKRLPHVKEALVNSPGLEVGSDNVYCNVYCDEDAMMDTHLDGPVDSELLWARGITKYRLAGGEQGLQKHIPGTQYYLIGSPIGDNSYMVQSTGPPGELTLNGARVLKYGQANLCHRYQPGAATRLGPICSVQVSFVRFIYICSRGHEASRPHQRMTLLTWCVGVQFDLISYKPGSKTAASKRVEEVHRLFAVKEAPPQLPTPVLQPLPASLQPRQWRKLGVNRTASSMGKSIQGESYHA